MQYEFSGFLTDEDHEVLENIIWSNHTMEECWEAVESLPPLQQRRIFESVMFKEE